MALAEISSTPAAAYAATRLERHPAGHLDRRVGARPGADHRDAVAHLVGRQVVEHHQVGARRDGFADLLGPFALDLDAPPRPGGTSRGHRVGDP